MTVRRRLFLSLIWTAVCFAAGGLGLYYIAYHPVAGMTDDVAAERLGNVVGFVLGLGTMALWLPYFLRVRRERQAGRAERG